MRLPKYSALLAVLALGLCLGTTQALRPDERRFAPDNATGVNGPAWNKTREFAISIQNATLQWALTFQRATTLEQTPYDLPVCSSAVYGACYKGPDSPYGARIKVLDPEVFVLKYDFKRFRAANGTKLATFKNEVPRKIIGKMCYSSVAFKDRGWRKKNKPYPRLTKNCIWSLGSKEYNEANMNGTFVFRMDDRKKADKITSATWFGMIWIECAPPTEGGEAQVCAFESTEFAPPVGAPFANGPNFVETESYNGVTTPLVIASSILGAIGPLFFFGYYFIDAMHYKRTGLSLQPGFARGPKTM